jgi:hypothetical protein
MSVTRSLIAISKVSISSFFLLSELTTLKVLVPGSVHSLHGQTVEWIFNHGARAVVTTSQLHTRGEIAPVVVNAVARAFAVPAPPGSFDESAEFSLTHAASPALDSSPVEFVHWSSDMVEESDDDSDDDSESNSARDSEMDEDIYSQLFVELVGVLEIVILFSLNEVLRSVRWRASKLIGILVSMKMSAGK